VQVLGWGRGVSSIKYRRGCHSVQLASALNELGGEFPPIDVMKFSTRSIAKSAWLWAKSHASAMCAGSQRRSYRFSFS
jgi:hypothetical protein